MVQEDAFELVVNNMKETPTNNKKTFARYMRKLNLGEFEQCYTKYNDFQPEYVGFITGCLVQYNGKTVPVESLRVME